MKKYFLLAILNVLLITQAQAQFKNQGAFVNITSGSSIKPSTVLSIPAALSPSTAG
ncbi:MAG: hypothetical protein IPK76_03100 [Lewinellaceae bacterium]|nr:hypothetical protein [Lewinellaceae bacterium]